jgi:HlyD family secretion protein
VVGVLALSLGVRAGIRWWQTKQSQLPAGIVYGNGRLEADEIDIETKFTERVAQLFVNEGDLVHAGQPLARMDTHDLDEQRQSAQATLLQAGRTIDEMQADIRQQQTQVEFGRKEVARYKMLVSKDYDTREHLDSTQQAYDGAVEALAATTAKLHEAENARDAARHVVELDKVNVADNMLVAPRDGRILYRIANLGEVLSTGSKVFTMLDATSVYMDIYLPTTEAGRVRLGDDGRIVLDAYPQNPIPATVSFLATQAQFTPKAVETKSDRDKLMFRVKVRIDSTFLHGNEGAVRTGLPGVAYVRVDTTLSWPPQLRGRTPAKPTS